jgi:dTDP-4-dehydrorhamnose reductase
VKVLVTGAGGMLGREAVRQLHERGHDVVACDRRALDITDAAQASAVCAAARPEAVLHCAAFTNVDAAEADRKQAFRVNFEGTSNVARAACEAGARFMYVSTDYVFDGESPEPYRPDATTNPPGVYGRTKLEGERAALLAEDTLIARTSWVYGKGGSNFPSRLLELARAGARIRAIVDQRSVPTWVHDTADVMIRLLEQRAPAGIYHTSSSGNASWYEFAREAVVLAGLDVQVEAVTVSELGLPAPRPRYSVLDVSGTERVVGPIRTWDDALAAAVRGGL